jgi:hypothetical protein
MWQMGATVCSQHAATPFDTEPTTSALKRFRLPSEALLTSRNIAATRMALSWCSDPDERFRVIHHDNAEARRIP